MERRDRSPFAVGVAVVEGESLRLRLTRLVQAPEVVVERVVLLHQDDHVLDGKLGEPVCRAPEIQGLGGVTRPRETGRGDTAASAALPGRGPAPRPRWRRRRS